ncbi:hypothetical protein EDD17DRAFT_1651106 [Pisolithus thermaeus]|nr:hypothetical protein EDD17DRAFT_1651106 [Pisolithus thermaeus]
MAYRYLSVGSVSVRLPQNAHEGEFSCCRGDILANTLLGTGKQDLPAAGCDETLTVWIVASHSLVKPTSRHITCTLEFGVRARPSSVPIVPLHSASNVPVGRQEPNTRWKTGAHTWHCGKGFSGNAVHGRKWPMICADKTEDAARTSLFQRESELRWSMWKWRASRKQVHASMSLDDYMVPAIRRCSAGPYLANLLICAVLTFLASPGIYEVIYEPRLNAHNAYRHFESVDFNVAPSTEGVAEEMQIKKRSTVFNMPNLVRKTFLSTTA